ncbi:MAG TPA: hypothetical protein VN787_08505 [Steroidobacteraceae bacterium]|nr:hypothetical protein [Steroidobacteraceae bacterium]
MTRSLAYLQGVTEVYRGEILGEALFSRLAALSDNADRRYLFSVLLQLESEAKIRLRPLLARLGLSVVEDEASRREGEARAERVVAQPWLDAVRDWTTWIDGIIATYVALAREAPTADREALEYMVRHEQALAAFLAAELAGKGESVAPVLSFLLHPLPRGPRA